MDKHNSIDCVWNNTPTVKETSKKCWLFHDWTKWSLCDCVCDSPIVQFFSSRNTESIVQGQVRQCKKCNLIQTKGL